MERPGASTNVVRSLRQRMTPTERYVWKQLKDRELHYKFRRQHPIAGYVLDFYCHEAKLCIEIDGEGHQTYHRQSDHRRDQVLAELGILTLRFKNEEVALNWSACAFKIFSTCIDRVSHIDRQDEEEP